MNIVNLISNLNIRINNFVWGPPMIILLIGAGIYMTFKLKFVQFKHFKFSLKQTIGRLFDKSDDFKNEDGDIDSLEAGMTALAGVVGSGNIAGVATAITMGGPGAIFWMWLAAVFGMASKFAEIALGVHYREKNKDGTFSGGPMYYLRDGLNNKWLAGFYSLMGVFTFFVMAGIVDSNSIALALNEQWGIAPIITGIVLVILTGIVIFGGIKRIGAVCQRITPFMGGLYILGGILIILLNITEVPSALMVIVKSAFNPVSATGGFAGVTVARTISIGAARGLYSNEAGMGNGAMIHSNAKTDHPAREALWGVSEVFLDTIIMCTITGLAIVLSGEWTSGVSSSALTMRAFSKLLPGEIGSYIVLFNMVLFGFTCLISMNHYSVTSGIYLFGEKSRLPINILWLVSIIIGSVGGLEFVWLLSDTTNGLMVVPNVIALIGLSGTVVKLKSNFFDKVNLDSDQSSKRIDNIG